jgi:hypothetical protein
MDNGTIILRPGADLSFSGRIYPETLKYGYLAINEELADDYSTYIFDKDEPQSEVTPAECTLSGNFFITPPIRVKKKIIDGNFCIAYWLNAKNKPVNPSVEAILYINGIQFSLPVLVYDADAYKGTGIQIISIEKIPSNVLEAINEVVIKNSSVPFISLSLTASIVDDGNSNGKALAMARIDQVYLELFYQNDIGIYDKIDGNYKVATAAYQKHNGIWSEIPEDEAKTILNNNTIRRG